jgi:hypothetical protein
VGNQRACVLLGEKRRGHYCRQRSPAAVRKRPRPCEQLKRDHVEVACAALRQNPEFGLCRGLCALGHLLLRANKRALKSKARRGARGKRYRRCGRGVPSRGLVEDALVFKKRHDVTDCHFDARFVCGHNVLAVARDFRIENLCHAGRRASEPCTGRVQAEISGSPAHNLRAPGEFFAAQRRKARRSDLLHDRDEAWQPGLEHLIAFLGQPANADGLRCGPWRRGTGGGCRRIFRERGAAGGRRCGQWGRLDFKRTYIRESRNVEPRGHRWPDLTGISVGGPLACEDDVHLPCAPDRCSQHARGRPGVRTRKSLVGQQNRAVAPHCERLTQGALRIRRAHREHGYVCPVTFFQHERLFDGVQIERIDDALKP